MPFGRCDRRGRSRSCESDERRTRTRGDLRHARERAQAGQRLVPLGAVPERAGVGHGPRGLQRGRRRRGTTFPHDHARSRAYRWSEDGLAGDLRRRAAALPRARALERPRPDPQGADLRAHRQRGQPRRGRQGVLVVPRRAAEPLPGRGGATTTRSARSPTPTWSRRTAAAAKPSRSTSCSTPASSTTTATGSSRSTTPRPTRTTCCMRVRSRTPARDADTLHVLPTAVVPQHVVVGARATEPPALRASRIGADRRPSTRSSARSSCGRADGDAADAAVLRERDQRGAAVRRRRAPPYPKDGINDHVVARRGDASTRSRRARRRRSGTALDGRSRARRVELRLRLRPAGRRRRDPWADFDDVVAERRGRGRRVLRRADAAAAPARRERCVMRQALRRACSGASSSTTTTSPAGSTATPPSRRRRRSGVARPQRRLAHLRRVRHHVDARHVGVPVVRGVGPRLPLRRARARRPGVREVPADRCCAASGSSTRTARSRPTSGRSTTSTRRCRRGRRSRCSAIDGGRDLEFLERVFDKLLSTSRGGSTARTPTATNLFEGGFLGLDNIGPIDRSHLPGRLTLEQSDAHRLDGVLLPDHARRSPRSWPARPGRRRTWS